MQVKSEKRGGFRFPGRGRAARRGAERLFVQSSEQFTSILSILSILSKISTKPKLLPAGGPGARKTRKEQGFCEMFESFEMFENFDGDCAEKELEGCFLSGRAALCRGRGLDGAGSPVGRAVPGEPLTLPAILSALPRVSAPLTPDSCSLFARLAGDGSPHPSAFSAAFYPTIFLLAWTEPRPPYEATVFLRAFSKTV